MWVYSGRSLITIDDRFFSLCSFSLTSALIWRSSSVIGTTPSPTKAACESRRLICFVTCTSSFPSVPRRVVVVVVVVTSSYSSSLSESSPPVRLACLPFPPPCLGGRVSGRFGGAGGRDWLSDQVYVRESVAYPSPVCCVEPWLAASLAAASLPAASPSGPAPSSLSLSEEAKSCSFVMPTEAPRPGCR